MSQSHPGNARQGLSVELPLDISAVETGRLALLAYLEPSNLEDRVINRIEVVLEELVSNVVRHATGATQLTLLANAGDKGISLCVEDDGPAFNPLAAPDRKDFDKLENAALGGLGIPLIKRLTKSLDYEHCGAFNRIRAVIAA